MDEIAMAAASVKMKFMMTFHLIELPWKNYHDREDFFAPQRHKEHKEKPL
jgi:hypothetical protein